VQLLAGFLQKSEKLRDILLAFCHRRAAPLAEAVIGLPDRLVDVIGAG
jgi:hypothetical protein